MMAAMPILSIAEALSTTDCIVQGCPNEADSGSHFCRHHAPDRWNDVLPTRRTRASATVPRVLEQGICKKCGEPEREGAPPRGPFARLCEKHYDEERARISEAMKEANSRRARMLAPEPAAPERVVVTEVDDRAFVTNHREEAVTPPEPSREVAVLDITVAMTNLDDAALALEQAKRRYLDALADLKRHPRLAALGLEIHEVETEYVVGEVVP